MITAASVDLPPLQQINVSAVVATPAVEVSSPTLSIQSEAVQPQQHEQLLFERLPPLQSQENQQGAGLVEVVVEDQIATASPQLSPPQQICVSAVSATVASPLSSSPTTKESSDPNDAAVAVPQHSDLVESIDVVVVEAVEEILQPTTNDYDYNVGSTVDVDGTIITEELQQQQKDVRMCKSDMISFKFETSLLRDESKLTVIFKSLPEYAEKTSELISEYQGDSVTGIFTPDYHHVCGQPIDDSNHNTQMRGVVYYVREISISECSTEEDEHLLIILCWADQTNKSNIYLERVSFEDYMRLLEEGFIWMYGANREEVAPSSLKFEEEDNVMEAEVQVEHDEHESMSTSAEMNDDILPCKDNIIYEALVLSEILPDLCLNATNECLTEMQRQNRSKIPVTSDEVLEELMHPDMVSIPMNQLETEQLLILELKKCNQMDGSKIITLDISGTIFYMSLMHYKRENTSAQLYNDTKKKRIEFLDFTRRSNDKLLYLWDSRQALVLSLLNDQNIFENRLFVAMTNLFMPFGDAAGTVNQDFVLLDILIRMDAYTNIDALVGVIETGEVRLWRHSKEHLRFLHCDFQFPLVRGEEFWIAKREAFYMESGLIYHEVRKIPRDPDISNLKSYFSADKAFLKDYPRVFTGKDGRDAVKQIANFEKWLLLPGKNITSEEQVENFMSKLVRAKASEEKKLADAEIKAAAVQAEEELREARKAKAAATRRKNKEAKEAQARVQVEDAATKAAVEAVAASLQGSLVTGRKSTRKHSEVEEVAVDPVKPAAVSKSSKSSRSVGALKTGDPREDSSGQQQAVIQPVPAAHFAVVSAGAPLSTGRNSAAPVPSSQVLTIVIDTTSNHQPMTSSSSSTSNASQVTAETHASELKAKAAQFSADQLASEIKASQLLAEKKAIEITNAFKVEQARLEVERAKELEEMKQQQHLLRLRQESDKLILDTQRHEHQAKAAQRKLDVENQRSQLEHDQEARFYKQMRRDADKSSHTNAMNRESASTDLDIQRSQWLLRKDIQEWEDRRNSKQAEDFRHNVERDSQVTWQREDALRRQESSNTWYSNLVEEASASRSSRNPTTKLLHQKKKQDHHRRDHKNSSKKRKRDDPKEEEKDEDDDEDGEEEGESDEEEQLIAPPFKLPAR